MPSERRKAAFRPGREIEHVEVEMDAVARVAGMGHLRPVRGEGAPAVDVSGRAVSGRAAPRHRAADGAAALVAAAIGAVDDGIALGGERAKEGHGSS